MREAKCILLHLDCFKKDAYNIKIPGVNYWSFDFYVLKKDINDIILFVLGKVSNYGLAKYNINIINEEVISKDIWSKESIENCLDSNFKIEKSFVRTLKK